MFPFLFDNLTLVISGDYCIFMDQVSCKTLSDVLNNYPHIVLIDL